jgi:hypothetical protein
MLVTDCADGFGANTGKKRRNTGCILSIFGAIMRQIGGAGNGKAFNQRFQL